MTLIGVQLRASAGDYFATFQRANAAVDDLERRTLRLEQANKVAWDVAKLSGFVFTLSTAKDAMDSLIARYNTLRGLDQGGLFFNTRRDVEALSRGLGDLTIQAQAASQAVRFASGELPITAASYQQFGAAARGFMLAGETRSIEEGLHAIELYITGGQSRSLHRLGIGVGTVPAYRNMAQTLGIGYMDLNAKQRAEARYNELVANISFGRTADFGAAASSSPFQSLGAFSQNISDHRIRSIAGAIEELANSLRVLERSDPKKIGDLMGVLTPLAYGAMGVAGIGFTTGRAAGPLRADLMAQQALRAEAAILGNSAWQQMTRAQMNLSAVTQQPVMQDYVYYNAAGVGTVMQRPVPGRFTTVPLLQGAQREAELGRAMSYQMIAGQQRDKMAGLEPQIARTQRALTTTTNWGAWSMAAVAGISAVSAAWVAYSNVIRDAKAAQDQVLSTNRALPGIAADIIMARRGGAYPEALTGAASAAGLNKANTDAFTKFLQTNPSEDAIATWLGDKMLLQDYIQGRDAGARNIRLDAWGNLLIDAFTLDRAGVVQNMGALINPGAVYDTGADAQRKRFAAAKPGETRAEIAQRLKMQGSEQSEELAELIARRQEAEEQARQMDILSRQMGYTPDVSYLQQAQISSARSYLGFKVPAEGAFTDADRQRLSGLQGGAMRTMIGAELAEEERRRLEKEKAATEAFQKRIDAYEKDTVITNKLARQQDSMFGANIKLLDETKTEEAAKRAATGLLELYADSLREGREDMFLASHSINEVDNAMRLLATSALNLDGQMREAATAILGGIPQAYGRAAGLLQAGGNANAAIYGATAGSNDFMAGGMGLYGNIQALYPQLAQYSLQRRLHQSMQALQRPGVTFDAAAEGLTPNQLAYFKTYAALSQPAQLQSLAASAAELTQMQTSLTSGIGSAAAGYGNFRNSLQGISPEDVPKIQAFLQSKYPGGITEGLGTLLAAARSYELPISTQSIEALEQYMASPLTGTGRNTLGPIEDLYSKGLDQAVSKEMTLIGSMDTLVSALDRNTAALLGKTDALALGPGSGPLGLQMPAGEEIVTIGGSTLPGINVPGATAATTGTKSLSQILSGIPSGSAITAKYPGVPANLSCVVRTREGLIAMAGDAPEAQALIQGFTASVKTTVPELDKHLKRTAYPVPGDIIVDADRGHMGLISRIDDTGKMAIWGTGNSGKPDSYKFGHLQFDNSGKQNFTAWTNPWAPGATMPTSGLTELDLGTIDVVGRRRATAGIRASASRVAGGLSNLPSDQWDFRSSGIPYYGPDGTDGWVSATPGPMLSLDQMGALSGPSGYVDNYTSEIGAWKPCPG